jgi:hypothetical protein
MEVCVTYVLKIWSINFTTYIFESAMPICKSYIPQYSTNDVNNHTIIWLLLLYFISPQSYSGFKFNI